MSLRNVSTDGRRGRAAGRDGGRCRRTEERGRRNGIYSTTFWLRLILKNRHRQKLRARPRARTRFGTCAPTIFICPTCSPFVPFSPPLALAFSRTRFRALPRLPRRRNIERSKETAPYNTRATFIVMHIPKLRIKHSTPLNNARTFERFSLSRYVRLSSSATSMSNYV